MGSEVTEIVEMQGVAGLFLRTGVGGQNFGKQWKWRRQNRIPVGEEDSADGEGEKSSEAFPKEGGIGDSGGAVVLRKTQNGGAGG